jgi:hypothetical protein
MVEEIEAWTLPSKTPSKKLKTHRDDEDMKSSAGRGPVGLSVARGSSGPC